MQVNCVFADLSYLSQLVIYTAVPFGIIVLLTIPRLIVTLFKGFDDKVVEHVKTQFWYECICKCVNLIWPPPPPSPHPSQIINQPSC